MALPFFYIPSFTAADPQLTLDEDTSRHIVQVLRMKPGERLRLTDGRGALLTAVILDDHKKKCRVRIEAVDTQASPARKVSIALSPLKNASRFEWFLEKATEIGVSAIIPLLTERTERQHTRPDRWQNILISALLQSQQAWLPELAEPMPFARLIATVRADQRFIAHCLEAPRPTASLAGVVRAARPAENQAGNGQGERAGSVLILIGPEGDFSAKEVELALAEGFIPVTLGSNRLRTETAGVVAATLLCIG
jgi:16S rRNA (uracil1498-N3)-methyltransferase